MASNRFGTIFTITTWGESHGKAIGVVIDGCPAGLPIREEEIALALLKRRPGFSPYTSQRSEPDVPELLSGIFQGVTTGAPISILIRNQDVQSSYYEQHREILRPGHANYTYQTKYGVFDHLGGGRASARETACRVAAGVIAKKLLAHYEIELVAYLEQVGELKVAAEERIASLRTHLEKSSLFWPCAKSEPAAVATLTEVMEEGDSVGGAVSFLAENLPAGLGDPIYEKLEAKLASALMSLPASKGFSIGSGFGAARYKGSTHNDLFSEVGVTKTNRAGGTLGGISTGMPLYGTVVFKPASSIGKTQESVDWEGKAATMAPFPPKRHDPCVAVRAVPVVEAMVALVLADSLLLNRGSRL